MSTTDRIDAGAPGTAEVLHPNRSLRAVAREVQAGHSVLLHGLRDAIRTPSGTYTNLRPAVGELLTDLGYLVAHHDPVDGLKFACEDDAERFHALLPGTGRPTLREPHAALTAFRQAVSQTEVPVACVLDYTEAVFQDPSFPDRIDREVLMLAKRACEDARNVELASGGRLRNVLLFVAEDLSQLPAWLYRNDPLVVSVELGLPDREDRRAYLEDHLDRFYGTVPPHERERVTELLAGLTDGMPIRDLDALRRTSHAARLPVTAPRTLVGLQRFGEREDPWERLPVERVAQAAEALGRRVVGQPAAVEATARILHRAKIGIEMTPSPDMGSVAPRGVSMLLGSTGVGKTELAKALAELLFGDERAMLRIDMAELSQSHSTASLIGSPAGYVGYGQGGRLTRFVQERPQSVLLFDEIDKAHPEVLKLFLGILEDGRLTDAAGTTAYFSQTIILFTSNEGASTVFEQVRSTGQAPTYPWLVDHFTRALEHKLSSELGHPELAGRLLKGVVVFDVLRPESVAAISRIGIDQLVASAAARNVTLTVDDTVVASVVAAMASADQLVYGARSIRTLIVERVQDPLVEWLLARLVAGQDPGAPVAAHVSLDADGRPVVTGHPR